MRGATFPIRLGELQSLEEVFTAGALVDLLKMVDLWACQAWAYLAINRLNRLAGFDARPTQGRWTA